MNIRNSLLKSEYIELYRTGMEADSKSRSMSLLEILHVAYAGIDVLVEIKQVALTVKCEHGCLYEYTVHMSMIDTMTNYCTVEAKSKAVELLRAAIEKSQDNINKYYAQIYGANRERLAMEKRIAKLNEKIAEINRTAAECKEMVTVQRGRIEACSSALKGIFQCVC